MTIQLPGIKGLEKEAKDFEQDMMDMGLDMKAVAKAAGTSFNPAIEDMTDLGNAVRFCKLYGEDVKYVEEWKRWIAWNGVYWQIVSPDQIVGRFVHPMVREHLVQLSKNIHDDGIRQKWWGHIKSSNSSSKIRAIITEAAPRLMIQVKDLNRNPTLFALQNVVIDLTTGKTIEPSKTDYITMAAPFDYDPDAKAPLYGTFVGDILVNKDGTPSPEMVDYIQRVFGYCLTPMTAEKVFFIGYGPTGDNGKTTLMEVMLHVLGEYGTVGADSLYFGDTGGGKNSDDLADLYGKRMVVTSETKKGSHFSAAKLKKITSTDTINAMRKFEKPFRFEPSHKLFLVCNDLPTFDPSDAAMIQRIRLIPFDYQVPSEKKDIHLLSKLKAERAGIFNWMLEGLKKWREGATLDEAHTPQAMLAAKSEYLDENDDLKDFEEKAVVKDPNGVISKEDLYIAYSNWAVSVGKAEYKLGTKNFTIRMRARGWVDGKSSDGSTRIWKGHTIKTTAGAAKLKAYESEVNRIINP